MQAPVTHVPWPGRGQSVCGVCGPFSIVMRAKDWENVNEEPKKSRARVSVGSLALAACLVVVLLATMWPTPLDADYGASIEKFLAVIHRNGVPLWFGYNKLEFSANVIMFMPIGFFVALLLSARVWWLAPLICPGLSIAIELTQAVVLSARFATVQDILSNTTGALIGILIAFVLRAAVYERDKKTIARALWERGLHV